jgi:hypothetical protein
MKITPRSDDEARRASSRELLKAGVSYIALISEAVEKKSRRDNDMIELLLLVQMPDGSERELRDWLVDAPAGAAKLRSAVVAVDALERYQAGLIEADDFAGRTVSIRCGIEKRRGLPDKNYVESYKAAPSSVVALHRSAG